ncbi:MAG: cobalamin ABC transporter substrate-binding protein [Myxococcota bacterium]
MRRAVPPFWACAVPFALLVAGTACGPSASGPNSVSASYWPVWDDTSRTLFDDQIEPAAVGLSLDVEPITQDRRFAERVRRAELVSRFRVQTVTREAMGQRRRYRLTLQVGRPPFLVQGFTADVINLTIAETAPSFGVVASLDTRLRGKVLIGFVRRFAGEPGGEPEVHFHFAADSEEIAEAIQQQVALEGLGAR